MRMRQLVVTIVLAIMLLAGIAPARADSSPMGQQMLMKLFGTEPITAEMFTPGFLAQASMDQIVGVFKETRARVGAAISVERSGPGYLVRTARFNIPVDLGLDAAGHVASLLIRTPVEVFASLEDVLGTIDQLHGKVGYLITRNGAVFRARGQTTQLAVSSGFKLGVLSALTDEIAAGRLGWDRVVTIAPAEMSLAPGLLQTFPISSPLTVHTLAALMVSQSDNTATDVLMDLVGRDKVAAKLGVDFVLTTAEFYKLKADPALKLRFAAAAAAGRRKASADMAAMPLPDPGDADGPLDPGIEWYLSSTRLCQLIGQVADLDVFSINTGVARKADWPQIAFKGGSEVGVASLTTQLTDKAGNSFCVSLTVNDSKPLNEAQVTSLYSSLIDKLEE
jgi:beta-lactamase class A